MKASGSESFGSAKDPDATIPPVAWPSIKLFVDVLAVWVASTALAATGTWPWVVSLVLNAVAGYVLFTISHEATHRALGRSLALNEWLGRAVNFLFAPHISFRFLRYMHMRHHRCTNQDEHDPDYYSSGGPAWLLPIRWATGDFNYLRIYLPLFSSRPRGEQVELIVTWLLMASIVAWSIAAGHFFLVLVLWILPSRITLFLLGWTFDYLPHYGLESSAGNDPIRATRHRAGGEPLLTLLLMYQNYHLLHHLQPRVPFYRYIRAWNRHEDAYLARRPVLVDVWGRPISVDAYLRRKRASA